MVEKRKYEEREKKDRIECQVNRLQRWKKRRGEGNEKGDEGKKEEKRGFRSPESGTTKGRPLEGQKIAHHRERESTIISTSFPL